jgi:hypothetical protein
MPPKLSHEQEALAIGRFLLGEHVFAIAEDLKVSYRTIYRILNSAGIHADYHRKLPLQPDPTLVEQAYQSGLPLKSIADGLGCTINSVHRTVKQNGMKRPVHYLIDDVTPEQEEKVLTLYGQGLGARVIAEDMGWGENRFWLVREILRKRGHPTRSRAEANRLRLKKGRQCDGE